MAIGNTGPVSINDIRVELRDPVASNESLGNYYRNSNANIPSRYAQNIPTSGPISLSDFRGMQGFDLRYESEFGYYGPPGNDPSPRLPEVDLGATVVSIVGTTKTLKKTVSVANTANKKNRWVIVTIAHFHWYEGNAGVAMFGNFRPLGGTSTLLKARNRTYDGETHRCAVHAFPISDSATSIELAWDQYGEAGELKGGGSYLLFYTLWGEFKVTIFTICGMQDSPVFRSAEDATMEAPNSVTITATESNTNPKRTSIFVITAGRLGTAGACTGVDQSFIQGGLGFYYDEQANSLSNTYNITHSTVTLSIAVAIDY